MSNRAYNYDFALYLEGVLVPFTSAQIMCTPNGNEVNINLFPNEKLYELKPKTAVQIFYRDWIYFDEKPGWRLMFDGYYSSFYKVDQAKSARSVGIICRDFRMDIRKAPAALAYMGDQQIGVMEYYHKAGLYHTSTRVVKGEKGKTKSSKSGEEQTKQVPIEVYSTGGLSDLGAAIARIAGVAGYKAVDKKKKGVSSYDKWKDAFNEDKSGSAQCGTFLDAAIRGMWLQSISGTSSGVFMNRRIRADKRFLIPKNKSGYNFWHRQTAGLEVGSVLMADSRFSSLEAAIMRLAGLFSVRVYSCCTPTLISIDDDKDGYAMDLQVKKYVTTTEKNNFGPKYILNECMLLPPLEFTAPPNCNLIFPPMYNSSQIQYDMDGDITRGYFNVVDTLTTPGGEQGLNGRSVQIPTALFNINSEYGKKTDRLGRSKPPLTLEERYKGVSMYQGSVEMMLACNDASSILADGTFKKSVSAQIQKEISQLQARVAKIKTRGTTDKVMKDRLPKDSRLELEAKIAELQNDLAKVAYGTKASFDKLTTNALERHALLKYLNTKYSGRVATVDMCFNPYIMCGFPGAIIADDEAEGGAAVKTVIGMVQQVKHMIIISPEGGEASTSVVLSNARFIDEPTDMDEFGNPLYVKATAKTEAKIDPKTYEFVKAHYVGTPKSPSMKDLNNEYYDLDDTQDAGEYVYVKDLLAITSPDVTDQIYIDRDYEPNRIAKFYTNLFKHKHEHFMIGNEFEGNEAYSFAYDSIHEALSELKKNKAELLNDYSKCIEFIHRDVCSADAFFHGILGLSSDVGNKVFKTYDGAILPEANKSAGVRINGYEPWKLESAYYGISTDQWNSKSKDIEGLKVENKGKMTDAGQFSSINELMPITALIQERRDAVMMYVQYLNKKIYGA